MEDDWRAMTEGVENLRLVGSFALGMWQVHRVGYGAMQLAGYNAFGPPRDRDEALRVLRAAVDNGINHIDTAQYYGPGVVNELIREALYPYPSDLHIAFVPFCPLGWPRGVQNAILTNPVVIDRVDAWGNSGADRACVVARRRVQHSFDSRYSNPYASHREHRIRDVQTGRVCPVRSDAAAPESCTARTVTVN
jgi:Aldo/keto reductase family